MIKRFVFLLMAFSILAGCVQQPPQHEWLTPESFVREEQLDERVQALESVCLLNQEEQTAALAEMRAMLIRSEQAASSPQGQQDSDPPVCGTESSETNKLLLGGSEWIGLPSMGTYMKARLDTGANLSSISAKEITPFERDGEDWIRFKLSLLENDVVVDSVREKTFEMPLLRYVRIVQASATDRRPVVRLPMTLGPIEQTVEITLNDRSHLSYPVLLGRDFMMDLIVVDVSQSYRQARPEFPGGEPSNIASRDQWEESEVMEE